MYEEVLPYVLYPGVIVCGRSSRRKPKPIRMSLLFPFTSFTSRSQEQVNILRVLCDPSWKEVRHGGRIDDRTRLIDADLL
jgi:hypothetical protein